MTIYKYILAKVESFKKDAIRLGVSGSLGLRGLRVSGVSGLGLGVSRRFRGK